ncbi:Flavin-dependent oxidoreductase, luciferase family (includes alkanesulfonate monooxygenase SsuD and methylene tetrahydromethanopterin reductase) [Amycolatopsis marina]|uniref:Flavin-dependent oxidoreductase, luciferase family (Includes alkanesulfonate monooxygenase SsuD and methylene tetrahydromethanopterin reductase) n=1 Tax=Amycolatopsis marina TaxID=490629 RepID=A0A1I0YII4_9PSEU|nr:LLM class flavin-dependent oxidoreductase [Amycolatopsis marina]SFB12158.1 Flavin-dependent oxidoreductase, luciferase family (includes alkanesulfonate monooxygenase SsuD and methylene tetrahydromethanopterin reductase) [Amycolatopsis marina]
MPGIGIGVGLPVLHETDARGSADIVALARHAEEVGIDSVAAADVLIGDGTFALEPVTVLATAAAVTERIRLEFGVLSLPTRPVAMVAAQVQSLQHLSGNRVRLGVGIGGFPGSSFWQAVGARSKARGRLVDEALRVLPGLIAGEPTELPAPPGQRERPVVTLAPAAPVPPILIGGGVAEAVLRRTAAYGDGWLPSAMTPSEVSSAVVRLRELAAERGRPTPGVYLGVHAVLGGGAGTRSAREAMVRQLGDFFGMPPEKIAQVTVTGGPDQIAERIAAFAAAGVTELGFALDGPDQLHQLDLLAEARALLE